MSERDDERPTVNSGSTTSLRDDDRQDPLGSATQVPSEIPAGFDRRRFIMRSAVISAAAVLTGCSRSETESKAAPPPTAAAASRRSCQPPPYRCPPDLNVVKKGQGPVMTVVDEFYKVGPGPSSSHTIGPMRITYDFYQRCTKLPADQLAKATGLKVHLFGSLSATGKGHGTERAALAGLLGPGAGHRRSLVSRQDARRTQSVIPVEARRQDVQSDAQRHRLRRDQRGLSSPQHHDGQAAGRRHRALRAGVLLGGRRLHRVERLHASQEEPAEVSVQNDGGTAEARGEQQADDRASDAGQRDVDLGQEPGGGLCLHRQDHGRDGGHREVRAQRPGRRLAGSDQVEDQSRDRLQARAG